MSYPNITVNRDFLSTDRNHIKTHKCQCHYIQFSLSDDGNFFYHSQKTFYAILRKYRSGVCVGGFRGGTAVVKGYQCDNEHQVFEGP